ncbi:serine hydrolase [Streptomyces sp. UNOC14_S4]|uniref:serine hydrolase domain-containing protein n=1 Tax=Streptomyces sp. UNOC14_S4 TaxID=2872340 RepID=UPI001E2996FD|nr:serine hydrolase domain-containing protein [Streptomyces sp. UNOC14_S4]MCC3768660.1 beta-lactamase family protein [Streptomyces sp. UNOC14_S4]
MTSLLSRRSLIGASVAGALLLTAAVPASAAFAAPAPAGSTVAGTTGTTGTPSVLPPLDPTALRAAISDLDHPQATGAQLRVSGSAGKWYGTSGVSDIRTGRAVHADDKFRAGSITKVFVATVMMQLAAEHRVSLDAPVRTYLPELLPEEYSRVTVGELLNHTSGFGDESGPGVPVMKTPEDIVAHRYDRWKPKDIVALVTNKPLKFTPGTKQEYRGINYILAALVVEKATGHAYAKEIDARILRPLGLTHTSFPGNDTKIHGPHVHGYLAMSDGKLKDVTEYGQSEAWGEGEMISTVDDLDTFIAALFSGKLLSKPALDKMLELPSKDVHMLNDGSPASYSMGLQTVTLNGVQMWGKTGERYGYNSGMFSTQDGQRRAVYSFNPTHRDSTQQQMTLRIADAITKAPDTKAPRH